MTFTSSGSWTALAALVDCQGWGEGGNGVTNSSGGGAGGGGGGYSEETHLSLTLSSNYSYTIGTGGTSTNTSFPGDAVTVLAHFGATGSGATGGAAGAASSNSISHAGGAGGAGINFQNAGGGGGGSGGAAGSGGNGGAGSGATAGAGGTAGTGSPGGAAGGKGGSGTGGAATGGTAPGGGGGGNSAGGSGPGAGARGQIVLIYTASVSGSATLAGTGTLTATGALAFPTGAPGNIQPGRTWLRKFGRGRRQAQPGYQIQTLQGTAALAGTGTLTALGSAPAPAVVNVWANNYGQGTTFTTITSALQSCVVPLTGTYSIGTGSGTPTEGNWLFTISSWTQDPQIINVHTGVSDDIHSWWRQYPAAGPNGNVRTSVSYTPNIARTVGNVYVAPDMEIAAINVIVVEVQGLGAWDTVTGIKAAYAAAAESLNLALGAPAQAAFWIAGVGGDNASSGQVFAPAGWTTVPAQTQTNGSNTLADNILSVAYLADSGSSQSVTATASTAENMAGFLLGVEVSAASPIPVLQNPNWPYVVFEAAFGAGFNTPNSEIGADGSTTTAVNWVDLTSRLWSFDETTGIQYQLGELQATNLEMELDNVDGYLSSLNVGSPYYSNAMNANMAFQGGISPWSAGDGGTITLSTAQAYASAPGAISNSSMQLHGNGSTANPAGFSEQFPVTGSWTYSVSAWFYSASSWASGVSTAINWYTSGNVYISTSSSVTVSPLPAATWTQVTNTGLTSPSNAAFGQIITEVAGTPTAGQLFYVAEAAMVPGGSTVLTGLVSPGTPIRLRAALGTLGGDVINRWYVIQRNAGEWNEQIDDNYRRYCNVTGTDLWAALSSVPPTFYRSEVVEDAPYAWWPMDDQPGNFGVLPATLLNAATGNTNVLNINVAPGGAIYQQTYNQAGATTGGAVLPPQDTTAAENVSPGVAIYQVGQTAGWMFGDPQGTAPTLDTGNPVTSNPGSASWQVAGQTGASGSYGWYAIVNDTGFPALSAGITVEVWFNYFFYASAQGFGTSSVGSGNLAPALQQPYNIPLTILELATASEPVAVLQMDASGHLHLITYNGATGTSNTIYSTSDLRSGSWHMITMTLTPTAWQVWLDGGGNANATGTATGMTSAWSYLIANADFGTGGGASPSGIVHCGNASFAHLAVYPYILPYYRVLDHYWAAVTAFGQLPSPTGVQTQWVESNFVPGIGDTTPPPLTGSYSPDGLNAGTYNIRSGIAMAARVAAVAPGVTSAASAWATGSTEGITNADQNTGTGTPFVLWAGLAPQFEVYTSAAPGGETGAALINGSIADFKSGYGASAAGDGTGQVAAGSGAAPPTTGTAIGDTVGQRIERLLRGGRCTSPQRSIDPAPLLVQAPGTQGGGIQVGSSIQEIQQSDNGMLFIDNVGNLCYWQRPHLAAQYSSPVWGIGPTTAAGRIPYYPHDIKWIADPHRIWNAVTIAPFSPSGAELPLIVPQDAGAVLQSQVKYGAQPLQVISWLQSATEQQNQANWLFGFFGVPQRRVEGVRIDAAPYPAAWNLVAGINIGDVVQVEDWVIGGGGNVYTYRVTEIKRKVRFHEEETTGSVELTCDAEPTSYWS